jgi:hypothetical protein
MAETLLDEAKINADSFQETSGGERRQRRLDSELRDVGTIQ